MKITEEMCDGFAAKGEELRAAVAYRIMQDKGDILAMVTTVPYDALVAFVKTGRISERHRNMLDAC